MISTTLHRHFIIATLHHDHMLDCRRQFNCVIGLVLERKHFASAPTAGKATSIYRQLTRASVSFAFVAEVAMVLLGGALKRRESLSARLGDAFKVNMSLETWYHLWTLAAGKEVP
jgi:hypothetical protein